MEEIVFLNGKFLPQSRASLPATEPGILYGWGLFETMRARNNKIVHFCRHLKRIKGSSRLAGINFPYSLSALKKYIKEAVKRNNLSDARIRLVILKGAGKTAITLITAKKYLPFPAAKYKQGFSCGISPFRQDEGSFLSRLKTTNRAIFRLSYLSAKNKGYDEAVILNSRGYLAEGSHSNLFFVKDGEIFTPALRCGCLDGITRKAVFDIAEKQGIKICEGNFTLKDLSGADEAFLTNSMMGIMPLKSIEGRLIGKRNPKRRFTKIFMKEYQLLLKNES